MFTFQPEYGKHFSDQFYLGIGTGVVVDDKFDNFSIPAFLRAEVDFNVNSSVIPYFSLQTGYDFSIGGGNSVVRLNPSIGVKLPVSNTVMFNLGFGYTRAMANGGGCDYLGLKTGLDFNTAGRGFVRFLKTLDYSVELETMTPVEWKESVDGAYKFKNFYGFRFAALAPLPVENLSVGLTGGLGSFKNTNEYYGGNQMYYNFMVRGKYKIKQLPLSQTIYPFAQLDMGLGAFGGIEDYAAFTVNPAIGLSVKTNDRHSADISIGYTSIPVGDNNETKGSFRIAVGYSF